MVLLELILPDCKTWTNVHQHSTSIQPLSQLGIISNDHFSS